MKVFKLSLHERNAEVQTAGPAIDRSVSRRWTRYPLSLWLLLLLAFVLGVLLGKTPFTLMADSSQSVLDPRTPMPILPTVTPAATPTPTLLELGDPLETLYIDIAPGDFAEIAAKREEALEQWVLLTSDADFVPATIRLGQDEIPVELRLKGDWADHFAHDKWSFRVETQNDHYLWGMKVFSLQDPSTRTFLNEWMFLENLRAEGVLSVDYRFVHVILNGEYKGIYALEEGFSKELLESQQRREGVIIRYNEDLVWEYRAAYANDEVIPRGINNFHLIDEFQSGRVNASPVLSAQRHAAVGELRALESGERTASQVFDLGTMAKFLALSDLWGSRHALVWHNLRYYYNPVTAQLEPIGFDAQPLAEEKPVALVELDGLRQTVAYDDLDLQRAYVQYLWEFTRPDYLATLHDQLGAEFDVLHAALLPEFGKDVLAPPWDLLAQRQASLRELLQPSQMVYATMPEAPMSVSSGTSFQVDVGNLLDFPVEVTSLIVGEQELPVQFAWVDSDSLDSVGMSNPDAGQIIILRPLPLEASSMRYARLNVPYEALVGGTLSSSSQIKIVTRVWGLTPTFTQTVVSDYPSPLPQGPFPRYPTLAEALVQHPYLNLLDETSDEKMLSIPSGVWDILGDLILPEGYGLYLGPNTRLRFGEESYLLANGPLIFEGSQDAPVILQPAEDQWQGVIVIDSDELSSLYYVVIEDTDAVDQEGWLLTGGITFYRSGIVLDHSRITGTRAEDGLNVIRAPFKFVDSEFAYTISDAFDADFGQGVIERCSFHHIGADGIDVSGSDVQVHDVRMVEIGDKGLSVGEESRVTAERLDLEGLDFGVVSKDLSQVTISDLSLTDVRIAGLSAYIKKPSYGPASITADRISFGDMPQDNWFLVQSGSWIDFEGSRVWGTEFDVDALYEKWQK